MSTSLTKHNIKVIRGDSYRLVLGIADGFSFVGDAPADYSARMVIRDKQSDDMPDLLEIPSLIYPGTDTRFAAMVGFIQFSARPEETQALPPYDLAYFVELIGQAGAYNRRLFEGSVKVSD
jgi:hypothetical protein